MCVEVVDENDVVSLYCGHTFHTSCIITLIKKRNRKCPLCRERIEWNINQFKKHHELRNSFIDENAIQTVKQYTQASRKRSIRSLQISSGDVLTAILKLCP